MIWRIELFGGPRLVGYGQVINRFESKRAAALLAYLALHPEIRHPRELLADRIWPDAPLEAARNRLKQALASLRRIMEPPSVPVGSVLDADRLGIGLRVGAFTCDVAEFRSLVESGDFAAAAKARKGELLPGFFDEWLDDVRLELSSYELELESAAPPRAPSAKEVANRQLIHIPAAISSFVGRERECREITEALSRSRWVSVTGMGGIGKTRTTQQVGRAWTGSDVYFVPLTGLDDVDQIPYAVISALAEEAPPGDPTQGLQTILHNGPCLLILDNAESFPAPAFSHLLVRLLEACSGLRLLVSSRIPFRSTAEAVYALSPLPLPDPDAEPKALIENESVRLFIDRARNARPDFQVTPSNAQTVSAICRKLEGSPLAMELCAAWSRLGTSVLLDKLEQGQALLSTRKGFSCDRHESTAQVFASTCALLSSDAVRLLGQLSLFRSGFELPMLDSFCLPAPAPEAISELIEASLIVPIYDSEPERFFLLESIRQHAEGLLSSEQATDCRRRYREYFAGLSCEAANSNSNSGLGIQDQGDWVRYLLRNWGCFNHAALIASEDDVAVAERIVLNTEWFWSLCIPGHEIVKALKNSSLPISRLFELSYLNANGPEDAVLAQFDVLLSDAEGEADEALMAEILLRMVKLKVRRQNMQGVEEMALRSADGFRRFGNHLSLGQALHILYNTSIQAGDYERAEQYRAEAEQSFRKCGSLVNQAALVYTQCRELYIQKKYEAALGALYKCRNIAAGLQSLRFMGRTANLFGVVLRHLGDERKARVYFYLALMASFRIRDTRDSHIPMWNLYLSLGAEERYREGVVIMGYAMAAYEDHFGGALQPDEVQLLEGFCAKAKQAIGPVQFAALESEGRRLCLEDAEQQVRAFLAEEMDLHRAEMKVFFSD